MQRNFFPELSIIVPVLNEAAELPDLFRTLSAQEGIGFELILCDGGSTDDTWRLAAEGAMNCPFNVRSCKTARGRGEQMNAGAGMADGEILLFLHADSRFDDRAALCSAVSAFRERLAESDTQAISARFALSFRRSENAPSLAYLYYEAKARLDRADCIRGDQGFMLSRPFFKQLGGFDTSLPFYEDVRLASRIKLQGDWLLLPAGISTSARRFETEGLTARQVVNAIIVNNSYAGWHEFFTALPGLYQCHADTGRLRLFPFLDGIRTLLARRSRRWRLAFWRATGRHVASNIWQIFFWLDVRRAFRANKGANEVNPSWLDFYSRYLERFFRNPFLDWATAAAVWIWFRALLIKSRYT